MKIIIPARLGSKGLPFKNRKLFKSTADTIPYSKKDSVWVTTDDPEIAKLSADWGFRLIRRPPELSSDEANIREVMQHAVEWIGSPTSDFLMLYLTYPQRTWAEIEAAFQYFKSFEDQGKADSLLCRKEIKTSPYLMLEETDSTGTFGKQLVSHDLYRRQDYPKCFEISHYISIFRGPALVSLNKNMYGPKTVFWPIGDPVDVDTQKDLNSLNVSFT